jgi:ligand-binding sensor domain-containing protein
MKKLSNTFVFIIYLTLFLCFQTAQIFGQWVQTNGPYGGPVNCFTFSGTNVYAGTPYGLFFSTNNGTSWTQVDSGLTNTDVRSLAVSSTSNGMIIFAGTPGGVFLSTNNGSSWALTNSVMNDVNVLAAITTSTGTILYAAENVGVFISTDNGKNWIKQSSGFIDSTVTAFAVSPFKGAANSSDSTLNLFAGTRSKGVYFSSNNGLSWKPMDTGITNEYMLSLNINLTISAGTNLFAGTRGGAFLFSSNGKSWTSINTGISNTQLLSLTAVPVNNGANLLAGTETGIYLSTNYGISWDEVMNSNGLLNTVSASPFTEYTNKIGKTNIFAGTANGIYLSQNYGASWSLILPGVFGSSFVLIPNGSGTNIFAGTYNLGITLSTDGGNTWNWVDNGLNGEFVYTMTVCSSANGGKSIIAEIGVYIFQRGPVPEGTFVSTNDGVSWNYFAHSNLPLVNSFAEINNSNTTSGQVNLYSGTIKEVFLSTDDDTSWVYKGLGNYVINSLVAYPVNS